MLYIYISLYIILDIKLCVFLYVFQWNCTFSHCNYCINTVFFSHHSFLHEKKTFSGLELMPKRTIFGNHGIVVWLWWLIQSKLYLHHPMIQFLVIIDSLWTKGVRRKLKCDLNVQYSNWDPVYNKNPAKNWQCNDMKAIL